MSRVTDQAWHAIVARGSSRAGMRGYQFHMANATIGLLIRERNLVEAPPMLYGVPIVRDESVPFGTILLKPRTDFQRDRSRQWEKN
jgi:hypothetical protein